MGIFSISFCIGIPVAVVLNQRLEGNLISFWVYPVTKSRFIAELAKNGELPHGETNFLYLLSVFVVACNWCS